MYILTDFYTLAIRRAVVFYTSVTIRRAVVFDTSAYARARGIVLMHFLHNIFMRFVDIGIL